MKKKMMELLVFIFVISVLSVTVFAEGSTIVPYTQLCSNCGQRLFVTTRNETATVSRPCEHGHPGYSDYFSEEFTRTYWECGSCHQGTLISSIPTGRTKDVCGYGAS